MKKTLILIFFITFPQFLLSNGFKPFVCNHHFATTIIGSSCEITNEYSFWKIYFNTSPYSSKNQCLDDSENTFNSNKLFNEMFPQFHPQYMPWWIVGCDQNWINK